MKNKKLLGRILTTTFYLLLIVFFVIYLHSIDLSKLSFSDFNYWYLGLAAIAGLTFRYFGAFIWTTILKTLGADNASFTPPLIYVYAKSWLGRYIPGTAPWILGKIYFASKLGVSKNKLAVSSLIEAALQIIVQILFAFTILVFDPRLDVISGGFKVLMALAIVGCLIMLIPRVFNAGFGLVYKLVKRKSFDLSHGVTTRTISQGFSLYVVAAVVSSLSLFFIAKAVYPELPFDQIWFVMGVGTLAGAVSMLAVFAPSGIGVREGIQLVLLSLIMPTEVALVVTIATRLLAVMTDLLFFGLAAALQKTDRSSA